MPCFTITIFRKFEFYEGKRRERQSQRRMRRLNKRNSIEEEEEEDEDEEEEEEEEDEVFPRVGVAPLRSPPDKANPPPLAPRYIE